jgi:hypothetical protein
MSVLYYLTIDGETRFWVDTSSMAEFIDFLGPHESVWIVPGTIED